jgi:acetyl-CoA acetyltransferase
MNFPQELEDAAFRSPDGEYAWQHTEALDAVRVLAGSRRAVLGGELWLVRDGEIWGGLLRKSGAPGVYAWETERLPEEPWSTYVARACSEALRAIQAAPTALRQGEVSVPSNAKVYYNLTWAGADE